jgi:hypothetical protein
MRIRLLLLSALFVVPPLVFAGGADGDRPDDRVVARARREVNAFREADLIVVGKLVEVHESPGVWCGILATRQDVTFSVEAVLAGKEAPAEVRVGFLLVAGSRFVDTKPRLDPGKFRPGSRWLLCLEKAKDRFEIRDETFGAKLLESPPAAPKEATAVLQALLDGPALDGYLHPEVKGRIPLILLANGFVSPPPVLTAGGAPVRILPRDRIGKRPFLEVTSLEIDGASAAVGISYAVEGLVGRVHLRRYEGVWHVVRTSAAEK